MTLPRHTIGEHLMGLALMAGTLAFGAPSGLPLAGSLGIFALGALLRGGQAPRGLLALPIACLWALSALAFIQILPLPPGLRAVLAPGTATLSQGIASPLGAMISIAPADTLQGGLFFAFGALGCRSLAAMTPEGRRRLQGWVLLTLCAVLTWAALQGLGIYGEWMENRRASKAIVAPLGPFLNRDHAAAFVLMALALSLPLVLSWTRGRLLALPLGLAAIVAVAASDSRGAILGLLGALFTLALALATLRRARLIIGGLLAAIPLGWVSAPALLWVVSKATGKTPGLGLRGSIWADSAALIGQQPLLGWGSGTFARAIPHRWSTQGGFFPAHAHSEPIEFVVEHGALGALVVVAFLSLLTLRTGWRLWSLGTAIPRPQEGPWAIATSLGALSALGAGLLHSAVDFHFHLGSLALLGLIATALALDPLEKEALPTLPQPRWPHWPPLLVISALGAATFTLPSHPKGPIDLRLEALFRGPAPYERCVEGALASAPGDLKKAGRGRRCGHRALRLSPASYVGALGVAVGTARAKGVSGATDAIKRWRALAPTRWEADWQLAFVHLRHHEIPKAQARLRAALTKSRVGQRPKRMAQLWRQPGAEEWLPPIAKAFPTASLKAAQRLAIATHPRAPVALRSLGSALLGEEGGWAWAVLILGAEESEGILKDSPLVDSKSDLENRETFLAAWKALQGGDGPGGLRALPERTRQEEPRLVALYAMGLVDSGQIDAKAMARILISQYGSWPNSKEVRGALLHCLRMTNDWETIQKFSEKWVSLEPNRPHLQHTLGEAHRALNLPGVASFRSRAQKGQNRHPLLAEAKCGCGQKIRDLGRNGMVGLNR